MTTNAEAKVQAIHINMRMKSGYASNVCMHMKPYTLRVFADQGFWLTLITGLRAINYGFEGY